LRVRGDAKGADEQGDADGKTLHSKSICRVQAST
jgi:hypothetical protein